MALGIGMLVDNAVVALENIQVHLESGLSRKEASSKGITEVVTAIVSSTLTTISVFLPITFVEGVAGQIFGDLSLAVVFSLLASLGVAIFFVPMLAASEFSFRGSRQVTTFKERWTAIQAFHGLGILDGFIRVFWAVVGNPKIAHTSSIHFTRVYLVLATLGGSKWSICSASNPKVVGLAVFGTLYQHLDQRYQTGAINPQMALGVIGVLFVHHWFRTTARHGATLLQNQNRDDSRSISSCRQTPISNCVSLKR